MWYGIKQVKIFYLFLCICRLYGLGLAAFKHMCYHCASEMNAGVWKVQECVKVNMRGDGFGMQ